MSKAKEKQAMDIHQQIISTPPFKLKDGGSSNHQIIDLKSQFGYIPRAILIEKIRGKNNVLVVSAVNDEIWALLMKKAGKEVKDGSSKDTQSGSGKEDDSKASNS